MLSYQANIFQCFPKVSAIDRSYVSWSQASYLWSCNPLD